MEHSEQGHAVKAAILSENYDAKDGKYFTQEAGWD